MQVRTVKTKLPKSIKRITILKASSGDQATDGRTAAGQVVIKRKRKRKKQSKGITRILEKLARGSARSNARSAEEYLGRHQRSNRKKRDGWLRDWSYNWSRARRKGSKQFKLSKIFG